MRAKLCENYSYIIVITMFLQIIDVNVCRGRAVTNVVYTNHAGRTTN